jgi:hypothetical protein
MKPLQLEGRTPFLTLDGRAIDKLELLGGKKTRLHFCARPVSDMCRLLLPQLILKRELSCSYDFNDVSLNGKHRFRRWQSYCY